MTLLHCLGYLLVLSDLLSSAGGPFLPRAGCPGRRGEALQGAELAGQDARGEPRCAHAAAAGWGPPVEGMVYMVAATTMPLMRMRVHVAQGSCRWAGRKRRPGRRRREGWCVRAAAWCMAPLGCSTCLDARSTTIGKVEHCVITAGRRRGTSRSAPKISIRPNFLMKGFTS